MITLHALQAWARTALMQVSDTPALDARVLWRHVSGDSDMQMIVRDRDPVAPERAEHFRACVQRRAVGEPVAHITGCREFWSLPLQVSADTLIPRPDTETLVQCALQHLPAGPVQIMDLGTGSGAIACALASERADAAVLAIDRSPAALAVACRNVDALGLSSQVACLEGDWFDAVPAGLQPQWQGRVQMIVSNPPYIAPEDPHLQQGDVRFEPRVALVAANDGLADLRTIIAAAMPWLAEHGWLLLEHGYDQGEAVRLMLQQQGFVAVASWRDLGGQERVSGGRRHDRV